MKILIILLILIVIAFIGFTVLCFVKAAGHADEKITKMKIKKSADSGFKNSV
ncbi:MAG: hypothetical protein IJA12_06475 [Oscillospiraceae bacterium]|nr:hypothetical protein [Oscillospiraceae bacterium]